MKINYLNYVNFFQMINSNFLQVTNFKLNKLMQNKLNS